VSALTVVKLGGSLAFSEALPAWLAAIAAGGGTSVLVVGGGPFADAVRSAQPRMGFDDVAADAMALLAMEQYAVAVASLEKSLVVAGSFPRIKRAVESGKIPVWAPSRMVHKARRLAASSSSRERVDIRPSWDLTSDSLAVWLARKVRARRLFLIKQVPLAACRSAGQSITAEHLARAGVVDNAFPRSLASATGVTGFLLGPHDAEDLARALSAGKPAGSRIDLVAGAEPIHHAAKPGKGVDDRVSPDDDHP
jgi:5-(aminomethyl)-3-furanmethanol phosphate kinase